MPLRVHFRSPVNDAHSWDELHGQWPGEIVRHLQTILPPGFRASPRVQLGGGFEVDIGAHELDSPVSDFSRETGGTATLAAPAPTYTVDADLLEQDEYEVRILDTERGRTLVAAIEIVSPANKVRPSKRDLFVSKCLALLQQDICVSIVDLVSIRQANLYAELLQRIGRADPKLGDAPPHLYSVSLRNRPDTPRRPLLDAWFYPMTVGLPLPTLPIWLAPELRILLPLDTSYEEACRVLRIK